MPESSEKSESEVSPEYKNLQTQLNKEREKNRQLLRDLLEKDETTATVTALEQKVDFLAKALVEGGALAEAEGMDKTFKRLAEERKATTAALATRRELVETLDAAGLDISDPRAEEVNRLWNAGSLDAALEKAKALKSAPTTDVDATVAAAVQKALQQAGHVDTGETNAPGVASMESLLKVDTRKLKTVAAQEDYKQKLDAAIARETKR